jgi:diguanylate cyclase (GGDEF)-like protein
VLLIDLDHFKSINDRFGHAIGDRVLELFAETAQKNLRASDLLGRLGGEEFAAVLYDTAEDKALEMAERLRVAFEQITQNVEGHEVRSTMSVGLAHCQAPLLDVPGLLAQADQALYFAKERGRNRVEVASLGLVLDRKDGAAQQAASKSAA